VYVNNPPTISTIPVKSIATARPRGTHFFENINFLSDIKSTNGSKIYAMVKARKSDIRIPFRK
jgi:hypothetical protein